MKKRLFLTILILLAFSIATHAKESLYDISKLPPKIVSPISKAYPELFDSQPTPENIDKILSILYGTGEFETLKIIETKGLFHIIGTSFKTITNIRITGENRISESDIINAFGISVGEKFIFQNIYEGAQRIKELYGKRGYFNAEVSIEPQVISDNKVYVNILIQENTPCLIKKIDFLTNYDDLKSDILKKTKSFLNKPLTEEAILDIENRVKEFFIENRILSGSIQGPLFEYNTEKTEAYVTYTLENTSQYLFFFDGNKYFSDSELTSKLDMDSRVQFGSNPTAEIASKLEKIYRSYGFAHISIKYREVNQRQSFLRKSYFTIQEGQRSYVKKIIFKGKLSRDPSFYTKIFKEFYNSSIYDLERVQIAQDAMIEWFQDRGFLKTKFLSVQTNFSKDQKEAEIELFLDEGPQTTIRSVQFPGVKAFSADQLKNLIDLQESAPLNLKSVETSTQKISNFYHSQGYLDMEMKSDLTKLIKYSSDNTSADIIYEIYEGPKIYVQKIVVEGNQKTKEYVILNELEFDIGDVLTPQKISDSQYHLQKTGLFSQVDISTLEKGTNIEKRTVLIRISERNPGLFNIGLGVNTEFNFTIRGYAGVGYNNIGGTARGMSARLELDRVADINFIDHTLTLGYLEPILFYKRVQGRVTLINSREVISRETEGVRILESNSANFLIEKDFTRAFKLTWVLYALSTNNEYYLSPHKPIERVNIGSIGPIFEFDKRDHPFVTRKGYYMRLAIEYSHPDLASSHGVHYLRNTAQINTYVPIRLLDTVWATQLGGGYLKNTEQIRTVRSPDKVGSSVPDIKTFKLGGRDTLRGYAPNEVPGTLDKNGNAVNVTDNSYYYLVKTEFRVPLYKQFESVFFYDGGLVYNRGNEFKYPYRDSAGVGFRYQTPVGPLSLEYGFKLERNRDLDESAGRFHLSFGTF